MGDAAGVGPGTADPAGPTLLQAAERHGAYRWAERRLFELTGAWAAEATAPEARIHLDVVSGQHAWHAELWADRLPVLDGVDREDLTGPAGPVLGPLFAELARAPGTVPRLAALYRVAVPRLLVTYDRHLLRAVPAADAPVVRALRLARRDGLEAWQAGEALLQRLLVGPDQAAAAAEAQARAEAAVVSAWAGAGLLPWPDECPPVARQAADQGPEQGSS